MLLVSFVLKGHQDKGNLLEEACGWGLAMASEDESMIIIARSLVAGRFGSGAVAESLHRIMIRKKE